MAKKDKQVKGKPKPPTPVEQKPEQKPPITNVQKGWESTEKDMDE